MPPFHGERMQVYGRVIRDIAGRAIERWPIGRPFSVHADHGRAVEGRPGHSGSLTPVIRALTSQRRRAIPTSYVTRDERAARRFLK